jgi:hypothetical protein
MFNRALTLTNVELSSTEVPQGLSKSIFFNGTDSSISLDMGSTLSTAENYTVELFCYFRSKVVFRLPRPRVLPGSNLTSKSFTANWQTVNNATSYILDVAKDTTFSTYVPGFNHTNVGNISTLEISSDKSSIVPRLKNTRISSSKGFVAEWSFSGNNLFYSYDIALDSNFQNTLYDSNRVVNSPYIALGNIENAKTLSLIPPDNEVENNNPFTSNSGTVLAGIFGNSTYPKLFYFLEESTIRLYPKDGYTLPAIAEDIDPMVWYHIAIVNTTKYTYLYINGERVDKVKNASFNNVVDIGYSIGHFNGYMTGIRVTKGIARYTDNNITVPSLPYSTN